MTRFVPRPDLISRMSIAWLAMLVLFGHGIVLAREPKFLLAWGQKGDKAGEFHQPGGIVLSPDGSMYVTDQCNHLRQFSICDL